MYTKIRYDKYCRIFFRTKHDLNSAMKAQVAESQFDLQHIAAMLLWLCPPLLVPY